MGHKWFDRQQVIGGWGEVMPVMWTPYGGLAYEALRQVVAEVKAGDPLAPVSVLVPTHLCGVIARRVLARWRWRGGRVLRVCRC